jgi:hypothetical protein
MKHLSIFLFLIHFCFLGEAQVSFEASTDAKQVIENGYFRITFTLNNAQGTNFTPPSFKNFRVLEGPSRSMSTTIINGNASQKVSFSYSLQPKKVGKFKIAPASIVVNGKSMKTNAVTIDVIKASAASKNAAEEQQLYVKAEIDTNNVYVGQQLVINYKLYTTVNIENYDIAFEPEYQGFFARDIRRYDSRVIREVIDGVQYTTKVLKRIALFPQQTGLQKLEPMTVRLGVIVGNNRSNSFFFSNKIKHVNVQTNALEISVKNLPKPIPSDFSGAVGKYAMNSFVDKTNLTTDDAVSVNLTIQGNGDIKRLQAPAIKFPDNFEIYDPKVFNEVSEETGGILKGQKSFEFLAIPRQKGNYELKPSFTYFDTDSARFITLLPNIFNINVRQGKGNPNGAVSTKPIVENKDIRYIKTATSFSNKSTPFPNTNVYYGLLFFPFLVLGGAFAYKQILLRNDSIDLIALKKKKAQKVAIKRLASAEQFLKANDSRNFYDEISRTLLGYICDKLSIPLSELTKDNVNQRLQDLKVKDQHITDFMSIIKITERALFAGMNNSGDMQATYEKSVKIISEIEEELN